MLSHSLVFVSTAYFEAQNNNFGGVVPSRFGTLPLLITLNLASNKLSSSIPELCSGEKQLKKLDLSNNQIVEQLPTSLAQCTDLGK